MQEPAKAFGAEGIEGAHFDGCSRVVGLKLYVYSL